MSFSSEIWRVLINIILERCLINWMIDGKDAKQKRNECHMRQRQENLICNHFQQDILSEEREDLGKSFVRIFEGPTNYTTLGLLC